MHYRGDSSDESDGVNPILKHDGSDFHPLRGPGELPTHLQGPVRRRTLDHQVHMQGSVHGKTSDRPVPPKSHVSSKASKERQQCIDKLKELCSKADKPLNIVFIGNEGVGKSSFINTVAAALRGEWQENATVGLGNSITLKVHRYTKCCMDIDREDQEKFKDVKLPTLIDVAGLEDNNDEPLAEFFRLLFYGHIQDLSSVQVVYNDCKTLSVEERRHKYSEWYPEMKVDRVIFVASMTLASDNADGDDSGTFDPTYNLPDKLMDCVKKVARPSGATESDRKREIPIFGLMTKKDLCEDLDNCNYQERKKAFLQALGLNETRFSLLSCYCDSIRSDLDIPALDFVCEVCEPSRTVVCEAETLPKDLELPQPQPKIKGQAWVLCILSVVLVVLLGIVMVLSAVTLFHLNLQDQFKEALKKLCANESLAKQMEEVVPLICTEASIQLKFWNWLSLSLRYIFTGPILRLLGWDT